MVTFNHEKHIRQALESLFGQEYDGLIELVVADDASTDSTVQIVTEYLHKDSRFEFVFLDNSENLGITKNYKRGFTACSAKYVAVLEGDDYWISPHKLQLQSDFLDVHWECDLCAANYFIFNEEKHEFHLRLLPDVCGFQLFSAQDLIADNVIGNFSTCMYRKSGLEGLPQSLFEVKSYDWIVNICMAKDRLIGFLKQPLSVYRLHSSGTWTGLSEMDKLKEQLEILPAYDRLTNMVFHNSFNALSKKLKRRITASSERSELILNKRRKIDYLPPFIVMALRLLTPPVLKDLVGRIIRKIKKVSYDKR